MNGFEEKVKNFSLLDRWCVLSNVPQNWNGS
jgi:hypothetical protein